MIQKQHLSCLYSPGKTIFYNNDTLCLQFLKVNKSQYIALFVISESIKKLFSIDCASSDYFFSTYFSKGFALRKSVNLPHIAYIVIH